MTFNCNELEIGAVYITREGKEAVYTGESGNTLYPYIFQHEGCTAWHRTDGSESVVSGEESPLDIIRKKDAPTAQSENINPFAQAVRIDYDQLVNKFTDIPPVDEEQEGFSRVHDISVELESSEPVKTLRDEIALLMLPEIYKASNDGTKHSEMVVGALDIADEYMRQRGSK